MSSDTRWLAAKSEGRQTRSYCGRSAVLLTQILRQRPGATLWSIVAGPLVNVVLAPIVMGFGRLSLVMGWYSAVPDLRSVIHDIFYIDVGLLAFNILPIYPLDGGQIFRALLWFVMGRARSLMVATIAGLIGIAAFIGLAISVARWLARRDVGLPADELLERTAARPSVVALREVASAGWLYLSGVQRASADRRFLEVREVWTGILDTFQTQAVCPNCATQFGVTKDARIVGVVRPISEWYAPAMTLSSTFPVPTTKIPHFSIYRPCS